MEVTCKLHPNMRFLKIREMWDKHDDNLVYNNRLTKQGISAYWRSLDASFQFNIKKRNEFLVRAKYRAMMSKAKNAVQTKKCEHGNCEREYDHDDLQELVPIFLKRKAATSDQFHWEKVNNLQRRKQPLTLPASTDFSASAYHF